MLFGAAPQISPLLLGSRRRPLSEIRKVLWLRVRRAGSAASSLFTRARPAGVPKTKLEPGGESQGPLAAVPRRRRLALKGGKD